MVKKFIPTVSEVYNKLLKEDPELYADLDEGSISISEGGSVRVNGRFVKGFSGNTRGRGPSKKVPKALVDLTKEEIKKFGKDAKAALEHMLETASSRKEVKEISKILISYQSPKLANVESRNIEQKTIEIKWVDDRVDMIDITPEEYKIQEDAAKALEGPLKEELEDELV